MDDNFEYDNSILDVETKGKENVEGMRRRI
jgi:hypothetical protein